MDANDLRVWIVNHNLEERSTAEFWKMFASYQQEQQDEFQEFFPDYKSELLKIYTSNFSLRMENWPECDRTHVVASYDVVYKEKLMGWFRVYYWLTGQVDDNAFHLYDL